MISKAIRKAFARAEKRNWDKLFWGIDIHETMIIPNWSDQEIPNVFYPHVVEVMQMITKRKDIVKILFTCSHPKEIDYYKKYFADHDIHFDYVNENPEVLSTRYGFYDKKPYFNVLIEDKSGFDPHEDWLVVKALLQEYPEISRSSVESKP